MFNCILHQWMSLDNPCPLCHRAKVVSSTTVNIDVVELSQQLTLEAKLKIAEEALEFYADGAGIEIVDEGRNYNVSPVAYENNYNGTDHMDKKVGELARKTLALMRGEK